MAYVTKDARGRSPYWFANYRDHTGRRIRKSTKLTAKSKALEMARALQKACDEARRGALTEARTRELLSEVLQSVNGGEGLRIFSVNEWLDHFVKLKRKSHSERTAAVYAQATRGFLAFLGPRARLNVAAITSRDIADFRDYRHSKGLAPATVNLDVSMLSAAFNSAWKQGHVSVNPCAAIEDLKDKPQRKGVFTPEQVSALVRCAESDMRGLVMAGFYSGQRLQDCANLRWRDVDLVSKIPTITFQVRKTGAEIVTVIHDTLENYFLSLPTPASDDAFLFPSLAQRPTSQLSKEFTKLMEAAHIEQRVIRERVKGGRSVNALSFHSLRHSFASLLAAGGIPEELRMLLTGHTQRATHQIYSHHDLQRLAGAVAVLPRI
ncbi:MAG: Tyrosine recombinase XerC [Candidatus Udaeobacter sp.]|jgi:integrase|nr:MAG: Tyrosine recombinase XerC [Candidatus Udaeobacter sp.]